MGGSAAPWLSVVMPIHNGAADLPATLDSVAAQPVDGIEFLLLDSSDDDQCERIVAGYVARHGDRLPLRYWKRQDVKPWPEKTNIGVGLAQASHVAMLHQDDLWLPGHVAEARRAIAAMDDAPLHIAPALLVDDQGQRIGRWSPPLRAGLHGGADMVERLLVQNFIAIPTPIVRRSTWLDTGGMDAELWYTADWDLYLKLARSGPVSIGAEATTAFRIHARSLTMTGSRNVANMREQMDIVLSRHGGGARRRTMRRAQASIGVNCGLAAMAMGEKRALSMALGALGSLGPRDLWGYFRDSRLVQRVRPRLALKLRGAL